MKRYHYAMSYACRGGFSWGSFTADDEITTAEQIKEALEALAPGQQTVPMAFPYLLRIEEVPAS